MRLTPQQASELALDLSTSGQAIAIATTSSSANLRWANNTLTTNGVMESAALTVIAFDGCRSASVSGPATTRDDVADLVAAADAGVRRAEPAEDCQPLVPARDEPGWSDPPGRTDIDVYADFASSLGDAFDRAAAESRLLYGFVNHEVTTTYLASSTGLRLRHLQPTGHYACTGKPADLSASAWVGGATRDFVGVDARELDQQLQRRLTWAQRSITLPAGRYDTILPPSSVADLMIDAYWGAGARVAADGQSVYARPGGGTRIGEQIAAPGVHLVSDPGLPGLECADFAVASSSSNESSVFDNGLPLAPTDWIRDGHLEALIQTRHSAALTGLPTTPMIDNLCLEVDGGAGDEQSMVADLQEGLLLTCLWYLREVDPQTMLLTGLTRDGVYVVKRGEIVGAANNFRFNESPIEILRRFSHAGATVPAFSREWGDDYFSRTAMPALRIPDFNMSSVSQAR
ncbi:MAG TPA: metallopeptidase TldD-related protein [Marmoricola sp.]|nr:metallopeptidase TldD-related protein [Marmoricola sp.]